MKQCPYFSTALKILFSNRFKRPCRRPGASGGAGNCPYPPVVIGIAGKAAYGSSCIGRIYASSNNTEVGAGRNLHFVGGSPCDAVPGKRSRSWNIDRKVSRGREDRCCQGNAIDGSEAPDR